MTYIPVKGLALIGGSAIFLAACVVQPEIAPIEDMPIIKPVQTEPVPPRPPATAGEAAFMFKGVCIDTAPDFERAARVLNQMPEIIISAESGYQHINLDISFSVQGGDGNKRCTMIFNSDDDPELVEKELNEVMNIPGITSRFTPPPRGRNLNIFSITVQAAPPAEAPVFDPAY
ncbi:MAG: hypothetical protein L3J37_12150 [Rhodobacteraceae bacterium]|nr:hypothetical protein [Paracoccaceae bacterium]